MEEKSKQTKKSNKGLIICVIIILLIIILFVAAKFIKDNEGMTYLEKFKNLFVIQDHMDLEKDNTSKYFLADYLKLEEKIGRDENFKYESVEFTNKLPSDLYEEFLQAQEEFMDEEEEKYFIKRELKTSAEIYDNMLFVFAIQTSYTQHMPVTDSFYSLYINLENNTVLSKNDVLAFFDYNIEGVYHKVLEALIENTNADHYYLQDEITIVDKEEFLKNIPLYAQGLSNEEVILIHLYMDEGRLHVAYIESSILSFLDLNYDRFMINETVNNIELVIITDEEVFTN